MVSNPYHKIKHKLYLETTANKQQLTVTEANRRLGDIRSCGNDKPVRPDNLLVVVTVDRQIRLPLPPVLELSSDCGPDKCQVK